MLDELSYDSKRKIGVSFVALIIAYGRQWDGESLLMLAGIWLVMYMALLLLGGLISIAARAFIGHENTEGNTDFLMVSLIASLAVLVVLFGPDLLHTIGPGDALRELAPR